MTTYLVTWKIELDARSAQQAADLALTIHRDCDSLATVFEVESLRNGETYLVDARTGACKKKEEA